MDIAEGEGDGLQFAVGVFAWSEKENKAMIIMSAMPQGSCAIAGSLLAMFAMRLMADVGTGLTWFAGGSFIFHAAKVRLRRWSVPKA